MGIINRLKHAWNAFTDQEKPSINYYNFGYSTNFRPDRVRFSRGNEKSIVTAVYNRIAIDCAAIPIRHIKVDNNNRFLSEVDSGLNRCLSVESNKDQHARAFMQDIVMSLFDEGVVAVVPIDTTHNIKKGTYEINSMRTGKVLQWFPDHILVECYNDKKGIKENLYFPKKEAAIIENPYFAVMNEKNSVAQRLIRKLNILDVIDEQSGSGKLDLIIQLPYIVKSDNRKIQAERRRKDIEEQLTNSKYGIAYTDGTEKITQLNRSVENNLLKQIEYLTSMLQSQLGVNEAILNGSASEEVMSSYLNSTVEPISAAISLEFNRKFLTKTSRTLGHRVDYFNDPFKVVTVSKIAEIADKFTRNEIMTSNEVRQVIGLKPVDDPRADELRNKNLKPAQTEEEVINNKIPDISDENGEIQNGTKKMGF